MSPTPPTADSPPAPRQRVTDLTPGEGVASSFHLAGIEQRAKKNGDPFFSLQLRDATGTVGAVMWDNHDALVSGAIRTDDFVFAEGHAAEYNGNVQVTLRRIAKLEDSAVNAADFLPKSPRPREDMEAELDAFIAQVQQPDLRRLLDRIFGHARLRDAFCTAPAAMRIHQAYVHGLLEHTLNVLRNALRLAEQYGPVDRDLLVTATLVHDIGKVREFDWRRTIVYSDEGRLLGHITIGAGLVDNTIRALQREPEGFPENFRQQILHMILSHHGKLEYGSPVVPKTREALLLHYADYTDAYMTGYLESVNEARARGEAWTSYNRLFESAMFAGMPETELPGGPIAQSLAALPRAEDTP